VVLAKQTVSLGQQNGFLTTCVSLYILLKFSFQKIIFMTKT